MQIKQKKYLLSNNLKGISGHMERNSQKFIRAFHLYIWQLFVWAGQMSVLKLETLGPLFKRDE